MDKFSVFIEGEVAITSNSGELTTVLNSLANGIVDIARVVHQGAIGGHLGNMDTQNIQGEVQKKLDVRSNEIFIESLSGVDSIIALVSEENEFPILVNENRHEGYVIFFDPLDGSSNIDVNGIVGSIFSIYKTKRRSENELDLLKYKSMFIEYVIDKKIIIFRKKKDEIIEKLEKLKFPKLSNVGNDKSYDYITNIPLFNLTEEKIEELKNKLKEKEKELEYVKITTPIQMWKIELKELLKEYTTWQDSKEKEFNNNISGDINISKLNKKTDIKKKNKVKKL